MVNGRDGRGNDTLFPQYNTPAFEAAIFPVVSATPPSGQIVQPKVLLAEWRSDSPGTIDLDNSLGFPVVTAWRDTTNTYTLSSPTLAQSPFWINPSNTPQERPCLSFDGVDDWLECLNMGAKLNNLSGFSSTMRINAMDPGVNMLGRVLWIESGAAGAARFGYAISNIGGSNFYLDANTLDSDPVNALTGNVYPYFGWATHTGRRDYLGGTARIDFNGGIKTEGGGIQTINYGDSTIPLRVRIGAQDLGQNPGAFYMYGFKLYTYYISDDEMLSDAAYYEALD